MNSLVSTLRLGWQALLFKEDAYEEMRRSANPVARGLILILVVGVVIALLGLVGTALELASTPDLGQIRDIIREYIPKMPFWSALEQGGPQALQAFEEWYNRGWEFFPQMFSASMGSAALGILTTPLFLILRWLIFGLLAHLFARWLGGKANLGETLGVTALAVAPQAINVLSLLPYVEVGSVVSIWGILCAYLGLKTAHKLSWGRAMWATLLPFILFAVGVFLLSCFSSIVIAAVIGGQS